MRWGKLLNAIFWNMEGWDCISTCTGLISEPRERTIPRGLFMSLAVTSLQYLLVLMVASGLDPANHPWQKWSDGSLPSIVGDTMGPIMGGILLVASIIGNAGMYLSEFMEDSYLLQGAAEMGIAPRVFAKKLPVTGAPYMANAFQFVLISVIAVFDFSDIIVFDNFFSGMAVLLEFVAFFVLRWKQPDLPRPYRVPNAALVLFIPALGFLSAMLYHCFVKSGKASVLTISAFALGIPYGVWVTARERQSHARGERSAFDELFDDGEEADKAESESRHCSGQSRHCR
jgi:amino acid transporter